MGDLIVLAERRADRSRRLESGRAAFFFDLACPLSYLAAEQVERRLGDVEWIPVRGAVPRPWEPGGQAPPGLEAFITHAEVLAAELRLPLVWPDRFPEPVPAALRAASYAAQAGAGHRFALAASRLAFCGGFDLEDPEILAEAAAAAGIGLDECLAAARDPRRDLEPVATGRGLVARGARELPVIALGERLFVGAGAATEAASLMRLRAVYGAPTG